MVTIGTAFEELVDELESMLDMVSESLDLMEKDKKDEAMRVLADLEEAMLDLLDYEEVEEEPEVVEVLRRTKVSSREQEAIAQEERFEDEVISTIAFLIPIKHSIGSFDGRHADKAAR
jgi:hypothetical protein